MKTYGATKMNEAVQTIVCSTWKDDVFPDLIIPVYKGNGRGPNASPAEERFMKADNIVVSRQTDRQRQTDECSWVSWRHGELILRPRGAPEKLHHPALHWSISHPSPNLTLTLTGTDERVCMSACMCVCSHISIIPISRYFLYLLAVP